MMQSPMLLLLLKSLYGLWAVAMLRPLLQNEVQLPLEETFLPLTTRDYLVGSLRPEVQKVTFMGKVRIPHAPMHGW